MEKSEKANEIKMVRGKKIIRSKRKKDKMRERERGKNLLFEICE